MKTPKANLGRAPKLSRTQEATLMLALVKTRKHRQLREPWRSDSRYLYAIKKEIDTVRVLGRLDLVIIQRGPWERICTYYELTDAGWLLAQALLDIKTARIAKSVTR